MKRHNFFLPESLVAELKSIASEKGMTMSEVIRTVLAQWLLEQNAETTA
jgi:antitoxin component of RelBE/YafQ-DinJ toxin-antitoxin module